MNLSNEYENEEKKESIKSNELQSGRKLNMNDLHDLLGHPCNAITCTTTKAMNIMLTGQF